MRSTRRTMMAAAVALGGVVLAGCSSGSGSGLPATSTSTSTSTSTTSSSGTSTSGSSTTPVAAKNLAVTDVVRSQLVAAGAALNSLPASAYTGLVPGTTYYAYDTATATYWAGAGLVPSSSSQQAQVSTQDDGSYLLFSRPSGGSWTAYDAGLAGVGGTQCPIPVPAAVLAVWDWASGTCRPPS